MQQSCLNSLHHCLYVSLVPANHISIVIVERIDDFVSCPKPPIVLPNATCIATSECAEQFPFAFEHALRSPSSQRDDLLLTAVHARGVSVSSNCQPFVP